MPALDPVFAKLGDLATELIEDFDLSRIQAESKRLGLDARFLQSFALSAGIIPVEPLSPSPSFPPIDIPCIPAVFTNFGQGRPAHFDPTLEPPSTLFRQESFSDADWQEIMECEQKFNRLLGFLAVEKPDIDEMDLAIGECWAESVTESELVKDGQILWTNFSQEQKLFFRRFKALKQKFFGHFGTTYEDAVTSLEQVIRKKKGGKQRPRFELLMDYRNHAARLQRKFDSDLVLSVAFFAFFSPP